MIDNRSVDQIVADTERVLAMQAPKQKAPAMPTRPVSLLDKHAHLRRTVGEHHQALQVHQAVLQKHAELHQVQAKAREALREHLVSELARARAIADGCWNLFEALEGSFVRRLRWLLTGR